MALRILPPGSSLQDVISVLNTLTRGLTQGFFFVPHTAAPASPLEGQVVFADGTNWNPGSGAGLYEYVGGSWSKL